MSCYRPLKGFRTPDGVVFAELGRHDILGSIELPCGQCIGCRIERSRQWAIRVMHEAQLHKENSFLTLTYDDKNIPEKGNLRHSDFQKFIKRLRKKRDIRYYMCGEYGEENGRPHYHAALFGESFIRDRYRWSKSNGHQLYRSPELEKIWGLGQVTIGELNFDTAQYVAKYIIDKYNDGEKYWGIMDVETGEIHERTRQYSKMSLKPAIGLNWLRLYHKEVNKGKIIFKGKEGTAPKYYRRYFKNTEAALDINETLIGEIRPEDNTHERLKAREAFTTHNIKKRK